MLALVANSGLNTMIDSFRQATDRWLQQRLVAPLYVRGEADVSQLEAWLGREAPGVRVAARYLTTVTALAPSQKRVSVEVVGLPTDPPFTHAVVLMDGLPDAAERFHAGAGAYISERAWRLDGWKPGDVLSLCAGIPGVPVLGIYRDYGNPQSQWLVLPSVFRQCWPQRGADSYALVGGQSVDWSQLRSEISSRFGLDKNMLILQKELIAAGLSVFDRTFTVTNALNALTLIVAGIGIFCAISAIHHHRLSQQALLSVLGVSRRERAVMLLLEWGVLGLLCVLLVWPIALLLAWVLSNRVTPAAFGWSFELLPEWRHLPVLFLTTAGALVMAIILPSLRLLRASPAYLLREQTT